MKIKKLVLTSLVIATAVPFAAQAQEQEAPTNFFADCGIGGAIFKNDIGGVLSNIIWDLGTTAVTSGLSSPETCEGMEVAVAEFINDTYVSISEETARGQGDHLTAMLGLAGCSAQNQSDVITSIRSSFAESLTDPSYTEKSDSQKAESYFNLLKEETAGVCELS